MEEIRKIIQDQTRRIESAFRETEALDNRPKISSKYSENRRNLESVRTVRPMAISTGSVQSSGNLSRKADEQTSPPTKRPRLLEDIVPDSWQKPLHSWREISRKYKLDDSRYKDFSFLRFLDIHDPYIKNYVRFTLGLENPVIVGRLKAHKEFWESINAPKDLISIINEGFKVPFISTPPPIYVPNNKSAMVKEHKDWVRSTLKEFLSFGFITEVKEIPYCCLPLQVAVHPSKLSLIHDESILNEYVEKTRFKLEGWEPMFFNSSNAAYGIQFDLKKFYFHIPINENFKKYFGFSYKMKDDEERSYFVFNTMPYGYTRAPLIAKNLIKPLIAKWRRLKILISVYFDDGFSVHHDKEFLEKCSNQILCDLLRAGLIPGLDKCHWEPQTKISWIGLKWDFERKGISVIDRRVNKLLDKLKDLFFRWPNVTYREISSLTGLLNSMYPVFEGREQLRSRILQTYVNFRHFYDKPWDSKISIEFEFLADMAKKELIFWIKNLSNLNFRSFRNRPSSVLGWTDASSKAIGGIVTRLNNPSIMNKFLCIDNIRSELIAGTTCSRLLHTDKDCGSAKIIFTSDNLKKKYSMSFSDIGKYTFFHRMLTPKEQEIDSNERELIAAKETVFGALSILKDSNLTIHFDNSTASKIAWKGSSKLRLQRHALQIDDFCLEHNIKLNCVNIPRDLNCFADELSKIVDYEDYSVSKEFFALSTADAKYCPSIDRFADNYNTKLANFNSKTFCIGSNGVDAFNYNWGLPHINWIFPPPRLLMRCLSHLRTSKGIGMILTPEWKGSDFYPFFNQFHESCKFFKRYQGHNVFVHGADKASHFGPKFNSAVNIWIFDFT